ncbi:MAG: DUF2550 domain-containing protein [Nocardioides sp.]
MPWWQWALDLLVSIVLATLLYGGALVLRQRVLARKGGTFEVSYRPLQKSPENGSSASWPVESGWLLGLGRYTDESLEWFRIFSVSPKPKRVWPRRQLTFANRRQPGTTEQISLYADHVVVTCELPEEKVELAMSPNSLMGFQAWLESGPPRPPVGL